MDATKKFPKNISLIIVFSYLVIFPLGQLLTITPDLFGKRIDINLSDLIILLSIPAYYLDKYENKLVKFVFVDFLFACGFSILFSLSYFTPIQVIIGSLYFLRLIAYFYFFKINYNLIKTKLITKELLLNSLIAISLATATLGWIQYFLLPNLTFLKILNWDDHLYRLVGTFLDPTFTALIIVFGIIISSVKEYKNSSFKIIISSFLIVSLVFTYSRASYLALFTAFVYLFIKKYNKYRKIWIITVFVLVSSFLILPRKSSEGTLLERTPSIYSKYYNYSETIQIIKEFPVFGIGFDNLCTERIRIFGGNPLSHACSGSDSSLLMVLATTGIVGFLIFINMVIKILDSVRKDIFGISFLACSAALFIHSLFAQSAFYPFVLGYMAILYSSAIQFKESK